MRTRTFFRLIALTVPFLIALPAYAGPAPETIADLTEGATMHGFRAEALYLGDADAPIGARFVHARTGFVFDLIRSQSVPQSFIWVNSFPTSDMGEPHTQEHLLLGKGNKGRYVASLEDMALTGSNAFTMQWRTCYNSHTSAGADVYFRVLRMQLDALLHPDYTDEEIRREVANFGVDRNPDGTLRLEEKGTVYNEMVSSFQSAWARMGHAVDVGLYGKSHPLSYVSGGSPAALRLLKPKAIRRFHNENYRLGNMGMIGSYPNDMGLADILTSMNDILDELEPPGTVSPGHVRTEADLPAPQPAPEGSLFLTEYPQQNAGQPGPVLMAWPPVLKQDLIDGMLLDLFLENIAGDPATNLYKTFVDSRTRKMDVGATSVFAWRSEDQGDPVMIGLGDVNPSSMNRESLDRVRRLIHDEFERVASWPADSPELSEFNDRLANRIIERRRANSKFVNSPPGFGFRGTGAEWMEQLRRLERTGTFRRSVTMGPELDSIRQLLSTPGNIWSAKLRSWKLIGTRPYAAAAVPSPELIRREAAEHDARIAAETARLRERYGVEDDQEALRLYRDDYDRKTVELDSIAALVKTPAFVDDPPLTLDDQLDFTVTDLQWNVPLISSTFENMTSGTVGIALRLDGVVEKDLPWLSLFPALIRNVGVIEEGKPISNEEMDDRIRQEILSLDTYFSTNFTTGRAELVVRSAGNDIEETKRAVEWMKLVLFSPNWTAANLGRIRDVVDQELSGLRNTMGRREEAWVNGPAAAYWRQDNPLLQTTESFMARTYNALRLRWLLMDPGDDRSSMTAETFFSDLAELPARFEENRMLRTYLTELLDCLQSDSNEGCDRNGPLGRMLVRYKSPDGGTSPLFRQAAHDLSLALSDIPDETLAADWEFLCRQMLEDLTVPPEDALAQLNGIRRGILRSGGARTFMIGSEASQLALTGPVLRLIGSLEQAPIEPATYSARRTIAERAREHSRGTMRPVFVGLVNPNSTSGVFLNSAPGCDYARTDREGLLDFLSSMLYSGGGAHGIFMKTWGAGLAYSNGIRISPRAGRIYYYAERCPALPQTLKFVIGELENAQFDSTLVEYAVAQCFAESRAASSYESRGESMAADLADGLTPEVVSRFRRTILDLRSEPNLAQELYGRLSSSCGRVLPGYGPHSADIDDGVYMVIGPEKQMDLYQEYLLSAEGPDALLYRLYPRDFWMR